MKILSLLFCICISFATYASPDLEKVYNKLKQHEEVFSMGLSKNITDFFDMDVDFDGKEKWITGDFKSGKMLVLKKSANTKSAKNIFLDENYVMVDLEQDDNSKETDSDEVYLFVDRKGARVEEAHFLVIGDENIVVLTVTGDIKVKNK